MESFNYKNSSAMFFLEDIGKRESKGKTQEKKYNKWTGEERESMYENVLKFPEGTAHLKYFQKNPHPDRVPDRELALAELFNQNLAKGKVSKSKLEFELVRRMLEPRLTTFEKELLTLPDVLQKEIDLTSDKDYKTFLTHLRDCFWRYFSTPVEKKYLPGIQWLDYDFIRDYDPARTAIADLGCNLFNDAAQKNLVEKLREAGAFGKDKKDFYLWNTSPYKWEDMSYQSRSVMWVDCSFAMETGWRVFKKTFAGQLFSNLTMPSNLLSNEYGALGKFNINALPEGYVEPKGNGKYDICVNKMYYFINDSFNFEGRETLGSWRVNKNEAGRKPRESWNLLENEDFSNFTRHGYGREFPVLSRLHEVENFEPRCLKGVSP